MPTDANGSASAASDATSAASSASAAALAASIATGAASSGANTGRARLVPAFQVSINGIPLSPVVLADLSSVSVYDEVNLPGMFTLRLVNWDVRLGRVSWSDSPLFAVGGSVTVKLGYVGQLTTLISGEITGLEPEFTAGELPMLTVRGYDRRHRLMGARQTRSFVNQKDSVIAQQVAAICGLPVQAVDTAIIHEYVLQHNQTDLDFLQERAARIGYGLTVEANVLHFRPTRQQGGPTLTLKLDEEILSFEPRLSIFGQPSELTVRGWNPQTKQAITGRASWREQLPMVGETAPPTAFGPAAVGIVDQPISTQAEADQYARGLLNARALDYITGSGECLGRADLRADSVVAIVGLGQRFSGAYYVQAATHTYQPGRGYRTSFDLRRSGT